MLTFKHSCNSQEHSYCRQCRCVCMGTYTVYLFFVLVVHSSEISDAAKERQTTALTLLTHFTTHYGATGDKGHWYSAIQKMNINAQSIWIFCSLSHHQLV